MVAFGSDCLIVSGINGIELLKLDSQGQIELKRKMFNEDINSSVIANNKLYSGGAKGKLYVHDPSSGALLCDLEPHSEAIQWYR